MKRAASWVVWAALACATPAPAQTARELLEAGIGLAQRGRFPEAAERLTQALAKDPRLAEAHYLLGLIRQQRGDRALARASFEAALQIDPGYAEAQSRLAEVLTYQARASETGIAEAAAACRRALALNPADADSHFHLGWLAAKARNHAEAVRAYQTVLKLQPKYPGARLALAMSQLELRQDGAALAVLQALVSAEPRNADARHYLGVALARTGSCAEAIVQLQQAAALAPENPQTQYTLATCFRKLGQEAEAADAMTRFRELRAGAANRMQARFLAASAHKHLMAGNLSEAIANYRKSLDLSADPTVAVDLGVALLKNGEAGAVPPLLEPLAEGNPLASYTLALAETQLGRFDKARARLESALTAQPAFPEAEYQLGVVLTHLGDAEGAARHFQAAQRLRPDLPQFRPPR